MSHQITSNSLTSPATVNSADAKVVCSCAAAAVEFLLFANGIAAKKTLTLGEGFLYNYYLVIKIFCIKFIFIDINMVTSVDTSYGAT
jgi:hypothetical protein